VVESTRSRKKKEGSGNWCNLDENKGWIDVIIDGGFFVYVTVTVCEHRSLWEMVVGCGTCWGFLSMDGDTVVVNVVLLVFKVNQFFLSDY
jgi:hypothetical protein